MNLSDFPELTPFSIGEEPLSKNPRHTAIGYWVEQEYVKGRGKPYNILHYVFRCSECEKDPEMFGEGLFESRKNNFQARGFCTCGCGQNSKPLNEEQCLIKLNRLIKDRGDIFSFKSWAEPFTGVNTRCVFECSEHGIWDTTLLSSVFYRGAGCKICSYDNTRKANSKSDSEWINQFKASGFYKEGTKFQRIANSSVKGKKVANWEVTCPDCHISWLSLPGNLVRGNIGCNCSNFRQDYAYILAVADSNKTPLGLKFGITFNPKNRLSQLIGKNSVDIQVLDFWKFPNTQLCRKAESICKTELTTHVICKVLMPDGWTETTLPHNMERIMDIYESFGGVRLYGNF